MLIIWICPEHKFKGQCCHDGYLVNFGVGQLIWELFRRCGDGGAGGKNRRKEGSSSWVMAAHPLILALGRQR